MAAKESKEVISARFSAAMDDYIGVMTQRDHSKMRRSLMNLQLMLTRVEAEHDALEGILAGYEMYLELHPGGATNGRQPGGSSRGR